MMLEACFHLMKILWYNTLLFKHLLTSIIKLKYRGAMKQELTDRMKKYQTSEYENFLRDRNVLDAKQFLHASMLYLNYALVSQKMFETIGQKSVEDGGENLFNNRVEVLGWNYRTDILLNKCAYEWCAYICNAIDCLLQYINSSMVLRLKVKSVTRQSILNKLGTSSEVSKKLTELMDDSTVVYLRSVYNYSKHSSELFGKQTFSDSQFKTKDVLIPNFRFRNNDFQEKVMRDTFREYEHLIELYTDVLDCVNKHLKKAQPISDRWHMTQLIIDNISFGEVISNNDITVHAKFDTDGVHIEKYWLENPKIVLNKEMEMMQFSSKNIGPHMGYIKNGYYSEWRKDRAS